MKHVLLLTGLSGCLLVSPFLQAATTVDTIHKHGYGANIGWLNFQGDLTQGAVFGQAYATGYVWSANCGWISLGHGPTNGWQYANTSAGDWGVNHDGLGNLRGYAYGANIGWIAFEATGAPRIDLLTGNLDGYIYSANVGWISLSNSQAFVQTTYLNPGPDTDADDIPDFWEYANTGSLTNLAAGQDFDQDNVPDEEEYQADTDPLDMASLLRVTGLSRTGNFNLVTWTIEPTRFYHLEKSASAEDNAPWTDSGLGLMLPVPSPILTGAITESLATNQYYRAKALVPLAP